MPFPLPSRGPAGPRRRSLLLAGAVGATGVLSVAGCTGDGSGEETESDTPAAERTRARAARDSLALAERYAAVLAVHPSLDGLLTPLRAEVLRHARAFGGDGATASPSASAPDASPAASASSSPGPSPSVPAGETDALSELASAERALADRRTTALLEAPGELARLLASVAAAGAAHAFLLTEETK
ncbi:hypothetical protein [Streptomyces minutiscleroticus]|uniref:Lipoprotein n=1 Tax=Streptomyces minutiscleroticus TaxID=68238 RepID=A0A918U744_9ACTN|nr:hypothetical protein [Streptomyces minutiscleroticus]GGY01585.1 lipoprotein [Streptomyces minutiscleroticus]